jgi:DNA polymerase III subunit alpha
MAQAGQNDLFGLTEENEITDNPAEAYSSQVEPWSEKEKLDAEKQTLGLFLTGHPIAEYLPELKHITHGTLANLQADAKRSKGKMEARVAGLIVEIRTRQSKQGKMMGFATLDDRTGRLEVAAYSNTFDKYRDLLTKDTVLIAEGGQAPITIEYSNDLAKTVLQLDDNWRVRPSDELIIRLRRFLSTDAVMVRYK